MNILQMLLTFLITLGLALLFSTLKEELLVSSRLVLAVELFSAV